MKTWIESSEEEIKLASQLSNLILESSPSNDKLIHTLQTLAKSFLSDKEAALDNKLQGFLVENNILGKINLNLPYSTTDKDLTTNLFNQITLRVRGSQLNLPDKGIVSTPGYLAYEMVKLAVSTYAQESLNISSQHILRVIDRDIQDSDVLRAIQGILTKIKWYDSSVGGGIFPLSILQFITYFKIPLTKDILINIYGCDKDPLFTEVAKIRTLLYYKTHGGNEEFNEVMSLLNNQFIASDALLSNPEQGILGTESFVPKVDVIIGNPPYIKADKLAFDDKRLLRDTYPSLFSGKADLYIYFIANAINSLNPNGVLCFISPAMFQKSLYGKEIRKYIQARSKVRALFDFDELPVFNKISSHLSVYALAKSDKSFKVLTKVFESLPESNTPLFALGNESSENGNITEIGWYISKNNIHKFIEDISSGKKALKEYLNTKIYSGIKTGHQKTYIIDENLAKDISNDDRTKKYIKTFLFPINIKRWKPSWERKYMIVIKSTDEIPKDSLLMKHLIKSKEILEKRSDLKGKVWYQLRDCSYYDLLNKPKIVFPDISKDNRFAIDKNGYYINDGSFFIPQEDYYLLGLLNSKLALQYFKIKCSSVGNANTKGRLRFKKTYVEDFPIPLPNDKNEDLAKGIELEAMNLSDNHGNEEHLNYLVNQIYGFQS